METHALGGTVELIKLGSRGQRKANTGFMNAYTDVIVLSVLHTTIVGTSAILYISLPWQALV